MIDIRRDLVLLILAFATFPVSAQTIIQREHIFHPSVASGRELRVFTYTRWRPDCTPDTPPQIEVRSSPAHGSVALRPGPSTVAVVRQGATNCVGKTAPGIGIWYMPAPGFRGTDQFDWDVVGSNSRSHDTAVIEVK